MTVESVPKPLVIKRNKDGANSTAPLPPPINIDEPPKPKGAPRGRRAKPKLSRDVAVAQCTTGVALADKGLTLLDARWATMPLSPLECGVLGQAVADEVLSSERLTALLIRMTQVGPHAKLAGVLVGIAIPRLILAGKLPDDLMFMAVDHDYKPPPTVPVETRGASNSNGGHGERQEYADVPPYPETSPFSSVPVESGRRSVPSGRDGENGVTSDERSELPSFTTFPTVR